MYSLLVLASKSANGLKFLEETFGNHCDIFVHLDRKVDLEQYRSETSDHLRNVYFIKERHNVYWGGFSMIHATISLISTALRESKASSFLLVSDDSTPLKTPQQIENSLSQYRNQISIRKVSPDTPLHDRYRGFFFLDSKFANPKHFPIDQRNFTEEHLRDFSRMLILMNRGKHKEDSLYHGSQWWALSRECLEFTLTQWNTNTWQRDSFEFSAIPDEMYFQTIAHEFLTISGQPSRYSGIMYADFSRSPKPFIFSDLSEFPKNLADVLFARKIHPAAALDIGRKIQNLAISST